MLFRSVVEVRDFEKGLHRYFKENHQELVEEIEREKALSDKLSKDLKKAISDYLAEYKLRGE